MLHYESQVVVEHIHAKDFVLQCRQQPLGSAAGIWKKTNRHIRIESAMISRTFLAVIIKGRKHRCERQAGLYLDYEKLN